MTTIIDDTCKYPNTRLMSEGTYYGMHEGEQRLVEIETLNHLMKCEILLQVLMKAGVHNWDGFEDAMDKYQEELK